MTRFFSKDKINAFLVHLAISLVIFLVLLYFILVHWYPYPLFTTEGGWQGVQLIAFVDIVLGPLLTLVIYKKAKPRLKLDLSIIAAIQFAALVSGTLVVYGEHPALIVFVQDHFKPVTAYQVKEAGITASLRDFSQLHPPVVYLDLPDTMDALQALFKSSLADQRPITLFGELYRPLTGGNAEKIRSAAIDMGSYLNSRPEEDRIKYQQYLDTTSGQGDGLIYIPLQSRYVYLIAVVDRETLRMVDVLDIEPPQYKTPEALLDTIN